MDRFGGYSEEENVQLKIYSDQDTHGMAACFIIFALVFCGLMYYDSGVTRWELIESVVLGGVPIISLTITGDEQRRMQGEFLENTSIL